MARPTLLSRLYLLFAFALALAGCGGGESLEPGVQQAEAVVGPTGAKLSVQELDLIVPANALPNEVAVSLRRDAPAEGEIARYTIAPAGLAMAEPIELRFERDELPADAGMFFELAGDRRLVPTTRSGNVLSARLKTLGYTTAAAAAAGSRERALSAGARNRPLEGENGNNGNVVIRKINCDEHVFQLSLRLKQVDPIVDMMEAVAIATDIDATQTACIALQLQVLEERSCEGLAAMIARAEVIFATDLAELNSIVTPLVSAKAFVERTGATCLNANPARVDDLLEIKFSQALAVIQSQQLRGDFTVVSGKRQLALVIAYVETCQRLELGALCKRLQDEFLPNLIDALRSEAFGRCRSTGFGLAVSQLRVLGGEFHDKDNFLGFGRFNEADLEVDLTYCTGPTLDLRVFDKAADIPEELPARAKTLNALGELGHYITSTDVAVPRTGSLTVGGLVRALQCADGSFSPGALVARINGVEVARRTVVGSEYTIRTSPLDLVLAKVLATVGLDPAQTSSFSVDVFREDGQCSEPFPKSPDRTAFTEPFKMFEIRVNLPSAEPVVRVLRGPFNVGFTSVEVDNSPLLVKPKRTETTLRLQGRLEERAGHLVVVSSSATGTIFETSAFVRATITKNPISGGECSFEHRFDNEKTTEFVVGPGQAISLGLSLAKTELTADEFGVDSLTKLTVKSKATLQNQKGDCQGINTSAPPDINDTGDGGLVFLSKLFSPTGTVKFSAPVVTSGETGLRSVRLSATASENPGSPRRSVSLSQTASLSVTLDDEAK